jgi:hypothetical protein
VRRARLTPRTARTPPLARRQSETAGVSERGASRCRRLLFRGELCWSTGYEQSRGPVAGSSTRRVAASGRFEWLGRGRGCPPRGSRGCSSALRWSFRCPRPLFGVTDTRSLRVPVGHGGGVHDPGGDADDCPRWKDSSGRSSETRGDRCEDAAWAHADARRPDDQADRHQNNPKHRYEDGNRDGNADGYGDRAGDNDRDRHGDVEVTTTEEKGKP